MVCEYKKFIKEIYYFDLRVCIVGCMNSECYYWI